MSITLPDSVKRELQFLRALNEQAVSLRETLASPSLDDMLESCYPGGKEQARLDWIENTKLINNEIAALENKVNA